MGFYKFIRIKGKGKEGSNTGFFVPRMYSLVGIFALKIFGFSYVKYRLQGYTLWYVTNEKDYSKAIEKLNELKKTRIFDYEVCDPI